MVERFDVEQRWPELFEPLTVEQRRAVLNSFASSWHEGWIPTRSDVENLTNFVRGVVDDAEYDRRAAERSRRLLEAIHSVEMAGLRVTADTYADADDYVDGLIDSDELVARTRARYGLT